VKLTAALLLLSLTWAQATNVLQIQAVQIQPVQIQPVQIQVETRPELTFNRAVPSVVTLTTPWGTQRASLRGGTLYPADPKNYWSDLKPVMVQVRAPANVAAGRYPVNIKTELYVCDQKLHLCSVRPAEAKGELTVGTGSALLILTLSIPKLRGF
jgi:hypothetical protein